MNSNTALMDQQQFDTTATANNRRLTGIRFSPVAAYLALWATSVLATSGVIR